MINEVKKEVDKILNNDKSGHGMDHINRVLNLSLKFAEKENADFEIVSLIALLHDVDDYKLFGIDNALNLTNAKKIMKECNIKPNIQKQVLLELNNIGYSKRLKGCCPISIEGKIVSDADMCDALGAISILRVCEYSLKVNRPFFDKNIFPMNEVTYEKYMNNSNSSGVCHIFEKILKLKTLMLTDYGKKEAKKRERIVIDFLYHLFEEEDALEWKNYLDNYLLIDKEGI